MVPGRGRATLRYRRYVEEGLARSDDEFIALAKKSPLVLGSEAFSRTMHAKYEEMVGGQVKMEDVSLRRISSKETPDKVLSEVCDRLGVTVNELRRKRRDGTVRAIAAYILLRRAKLTQRDVAEQLGIRTGAAVSYLLRVLRERLAGDNALARQIKLLLKARS